MSAPRPGEAGSDDGESGFSLGEFEYEGGAEELEGERGAKEREALTYAEKAEFSSLSDDGVYPVLCTI
jgi:hypothetical protein